jgi:hypothetical protein
MKINRQSGSAHVIIIIVLAVALLAAVGVLFWQNIINKPTAQESNITTYAGCVTSEGSLKQETYPEVCVTKSGQHFTNPDQKSVASVATKSYCAPLEKICFDYPSNWSVIAAKVDPENDGVAEKMYVADETGKKWLMLETGLSGVGGACGNNDGSYTKVEKTHTTTIAQTNTTADAKKYSADSVYAVGWITYSGTDKNWKVDMGLRGSKAATEIAKIDPCDLGLGVVGGKHASGVAGSDVAGPLLFNDYAGEGADSMPTYKTEAEATAFLASSNAGKAFDILQSAHYE